MRSETDYLRSELIRARAILADCAGLFNAADTVVPEFTALPTVERVRTAIAAFQMHGIAVLPEGVSA